MTYQDRQCVCRECGQEFTFTVRMQKRFSEKGSEPPTRCAECFKQLKVKADPGPAQSIPRKPVTATSHTDSPAGAMTFARFGLDQRLTRAIGEAGYETPTPVQAAAIPIGLAGRDIVGTAQTGTGKTAAFVLPILQHLLASPAAKHRTRVLVLTPTRELAEQINETFRQLARFTDITSATVYGGVSMGPQEKALRTGTDVIVACPGRLLDHIDRGNTDFSRVTKLVLDEADRMLDMGFLPSIRRILSHLPRERHSMLFSATFAPELMQLAKDTLKDPQRVDVDICAPPKTIAHALYPCPQHLKTSLVLGILADTDVNSVLIFTRTKHRADRVAQQIKRAGYATAALHADRSQNQRQLALDDFRLGRCQILVATDIAARGLDVATISHVINYDIPATADTYIHRIGRTGRMEREGDAMTLVDPADSEIVVEIEKALRTPIERRKLDGFDYSAPPPARDGVRQAPSARHNQSRAPRTPGRSRSSTKPDAARSRTYIAEQCIARAMQSGG